MNTVISILIIIRGDYTLSAFNARRADVCQGTWKQVIRSTCMEFMCAMLLVIGC